MKPVIKIGDSFKAQGKTCVVGVPIADFDMANVEYLFIQEKKYKVLAFDTKVAI